MKNNKKGEYAVFQLKIMRRFCAYAFISLFAVIAVYLFLWKQRVGEWIVRGLEYCLKLKHEQAFLIYHDYFRNNREIFFSIAIILIFIVLLWRLFHWMTKYFKEIDRGIDALLAKDIIPIRLSSEMFPFERKLNAVKQTLEEQKRETALAEQRKDELVMYLAHDIRTPLTSVIGYLTLLEGVAHMSPTEQERNVQIALDKAYRLEEMINEFFEITRYRSQQIHLTKESVDLYYLLSQLIDELSSILTPHGNVVKLNVDEEIILLADVGKLVRVFENILKNAAAYSFPNTEIIITVRETQTHYQLSFQNQGPPIPSEELPFLFDKFYRLDKSRNSDSGGTGLGLAIAKEIILLHGGDIYAESEGNTITFTILLLKAES